MAAIANHPFVSDPLKILNWFTTASIGDACPLVVIGRLAVVFTAPLLSMFIVSLAVEDQRNFVSCRLSGSSVDACILAIHGR